LTRAGIPPLVSLFERRVVILPDKGVGQRLNRDNLQTISAGMTAAL